MEIAFLADFVHYLPTLARWHHEQFGYLAPEASLESNVAALQRTLNRGAIPTTFIALAGEVLLGSASLVRHDLSSRPNLTPWLARVYVAPEHRRQGVGTALVSRAVAEAEQLGVEKLYLYTPDKERFYARLGWSVRERLKYRGWDTVIMQISPVTIVAASCAERGGSTSFGFR
jgi:GNAT superfamily N-acetyltransferase